MAGVFGSDGANWVAGIQEWTAIQRSFPRTEPRIVLLPGRELPADEVGAKADAGARPVKPAFQDLLNLEEEAYLQWKETDYAQLQELEERYAGVLVDLPVAGPANETPLVTELRRTMDLSVWRVQQSLALFGGVIAVREGQVGEAELALETARGISEAVLPVVAEQEKSYRYPVELMAREKESLTSYPFGAFYDTYTGYFWTRRDDQFAAFLDGVFSVLNEAWEEEPVFVAQAGSAEIVLEEPSDAVASAVIGAFMPTFCSASFRTGKATPSKWQRIPTGTGNRTRGPSKLFPGRSGEGTFQEAAPSRGAAHRFRRGADLQPELTEVDVQMSLTDTPEWSVGAGSLSAKVPPAWVGTIASFDGIDEAGAAGLIASIYGFEPGAELPEKSSILLFHDTASLSVDPCRGPCLNNRKSPWMAGKTVARLRHTH